MKKFLNGFAKHFIWWVSILLACFFAIGVVTIGRVLIILSFVTWWGIWALILFVIVVLSILGGLSE